MHRLYYSARTRVDTLGGNAGGMAFGLSGSGRFVRRELSI